jgi:hypothetical protein
LLQCHPLTRRKLAISATIWDSEARSDLSVQTRLVVGMATLISMVR